MSVPPRPAGVRTVAILVLALAGSAHAQRLDLAPPGDRDFVLDAAGVLPEADEAGIREICDAVLTDTAIPIVVVTIESMARHGGADWRIETFATVLFNQWGIGAEKIGNRDWNRGILFLVAVKDRKARIELGAGWGREKDATSARIMNEIVIPRFKAGDYPGGIRGGVDGLAAMARGVEIPRPPTPWWVYAIGIGFVALAIFTIVSLVRRGASGWAWLFWAAVFGLVGYLLYNAMQSNRGGGFSGGSFGGGFSGGGGATGSW